MNNIIFIYNIIITIALSIGLTGYYVIFKKNKQKEFLLLAILLFIFILDNSTAYISEYSESFYLVYENSSLFYVFLDATYLSMLLVIRFIIAEHFNDRFSLYEIGTFICLPIALLTISILAPTTVSEIAIYTCFYSAFIYLILKILYNMKKTTDNQNESYSKYRLVLMLGVGLSGLGILENVFYNLVPENSTFLNATILEYRFLSFDILKLFVIIAVLHYLFTSFETLFNSKSSDEKLEAFCEKHTLTSRQKVIIELILKGCSNKEIGEQLHITEGTVKTHIYNIFKKTNISNRNQIITTVMNS